MGKVQSSRTLSISPEIWGAFHSTKTCRLNFRQFPVANRAAFSKLSIKEDNLAWYTQIFQKPFSEVFFPFKGFNLFPEFQEASFEWFRLFGNSTVPGISGNFYGKCLYHLPLFPNFWKLWLNGNKAPMVYAWCTGSPWYYCLREKPWERGYMRNSRY